MRGGYDPPLHPSTLALSGYPAAGSGDTAELTFNVTYTGGAGAGAGGHPPVRLDVTGSEYSHLYRVTNITSNIGTAAPGAFEPYDHRTEDAAAEPGQTYTVRALVEFVAEGFVPVYARGLDGDIVTIDMAASRDMSMPYLDYLAMREDYLDDTLAEAGPVRARERALDPGAAPALEKRHGPLKDLLSPPPPPPGGPSAGADRPARPPFAAAGTVVTANHARNGSMPVHGIQVCAYDLSMGGGGLASTRLNTTEGEPACAYTDDAGRYEIPGIAGDDPHDATAADVFLAVHSRGYGGAITLVHYIDGGGGGGSRYLLYTDDSDAASAELDYEGARYARDLDLTRAGAGMPGAARIISTLSDGMAFFEGHGQEPAGLTVKWHHRRGASFFPDKPTDGAAYLPGGAVMWLDGLSHATYDNSEDRRIILHELGHHVHAVHDPGLEYSCPVHYYTGKYDERCAWGEGWAQLVPHLVYDSAVISSGTRGGQADIEAGSIRYGPRGAAVYYSDTFEDSGRPIGEKVEGSVAAAMWDLADSETHPVFDMAPAPPPAGPAGLDDAAAGPAAVVSVFFGGTYDTFAEFYDRWEIDMRRHSAERVAALHGMSFAIPNETPYYRFAGELGGVLGSGLAGLWFRPNYIDVSADGSTAAVTSLRGQGMQLVDVRGGASLGLHAAYGYDNACMLELDWRRCYLDDAARSSADLGAAQFSSMDGVALDASAGRVLVTDGYQDRVHVFGAGGGHLGQFGRTGAGAGEFDQPDGAAFLPGGAAAVADSGNRRVQAFEIGAGGAAVYAGQFVSQAPASAPPFYTTQQLAAGPGGTLYAADYGRPSIWVYSPGPGGLPGSALLIDDPSVQGFGGIAVDSSGLAYVSDPARGRVRVYDPGGLRGDIDESESMLGGLPLAVRAVPRGGEAFLDEFGSRGPHPWQLGWPLGVALGPPDAGTGDARVYVADVYGVKVYEKDRTRPAVTGVWSHTPDGTLAAGSGAAEIAVNFSERVTVEGEPVLAMPGAGGPRAGAAYASGSGSRTLTFSYEVPAGAGPGYLGHAGAGPLALAGPGASIMDGSGNAANLTLPAPGTAASLAANAALWIDPGGHPDPAVRIRPVPTVAALEGRAVRIDVNATAAAAANATAAAGVSYTWIGPPAGAAALANGTLSWTPAENQSGMHEFAVSATVDGPAAASHIRAVRVWVAEDNEPPVVEAIRDMDAAELAEIRFDVVASDADVPAQRLRYGLEGGGVPDGATVLPNGTFVWTPSVYDGGIHAFNVSVSDGFVYGDARDDNRTGTAFAAFAVSVAEAPQPPPTVVWVSSPDGTYGAGEDVYISVEFSAPVVVRGSPELLLDAGAGGPPALAAYDSGNLTSTLAFRYAVAPAHDTGRLGYAGTGALSAGAGIEAASGEAAVLDLPAPGSPGSLSSTSYVAVATTSPVLDIGVLYEWAAADATTRAAQLSAGEFNAGSEGVLLSVAHYPYLSSPSPFYPGLAAVDALRLAHAGGGGPDVYVGSLGDRDLHDAMQYAAESGIVLVSTDSAAPSLAVEGDRTFRMRPSDGLQASALARLALRAGAGSVYAVLENASYGPAGRPDVPPPPGRFSHGFAAALADSAVPYLGATITMAGEGGRSAAAAAAAAALAGAVRADDAPSAAVVYLGSPEGLAALAAHAAGHPDLTSAQWLASDLSAGSGLLAGGGIAARFAASTGLTAVEWSAPENELTREIDSRVPHRLAGIPRQNYAAYDAVAVLGAAAAGAGGTDAADIAGRLHAAAAAYDGALGDIVLDPAGDLWVPAAYGVWTVRQAGQGAAPEWVRQQDVDEARACSISLAAGFLDFGPVNPGQYTRPVRQTVTNSGQLPFVDVDLRATPWYAGSGGECSEGIYPSLPTGLSEIRPEPGGAFAALAPAGTTVAGGLEAGGEAPLWYRINLTGYADLPRTTMAQCVTYVVEC